MIKGVGILISICGMAVLYGWHQDVTWLKSIIPNWVTMKPSTAISFVMAGQMVFYMNCKFTDRGNLAELAMTTASLSIVLLMSGILFESLSQMNIGFANLFFREPEGAIATVKSGHPSIGTIACFLLSAWVALIIVICKRNLRKVRMRIGWSIFGIGSIVVLGYMCSAPVLYFHWPGISTAMALSTAVLFELLGLLLVLSHPKLPGGSQ